MTRLQLRLAREGGHALSEYPPDSTGRRPERPPQRYRGLTLVVPNGDLVMLDLLASRGAETNARDAAWARGADAAVLAEKIGVKKYLDALTVRHAERDAETLRHDLIPLGWGERNGLVLSGERDGRAALDKYLQKWLLNNANANTHLFLYFTGNGATDPKTRTAYHFRRDGDAAL